MIAKEWRDARWKFGAAAVVVLLAVFVAPVPMPYSELSGAYGTDQLSQPAASELWSLYSAGSVFVLLPLAALLGAALISEESNRGTVFFLLSKPVGRTRLLLTKYIVNAIVLLIAAVLGAALVVLAGAARGYPLGQIVSASGLASSVMLAWLGALFVLGIALTASVLLRNVIYSLSATGLLILLVLTFPGNLYEIFYFLDYRPRFGLRLYEISQSFSPLYLLIDGGWFEGEYTPAGSFVFWLIAATATLLLATWLFRRKAY